MILDPFGSFLVSLGRQKGASGAKDSSSAKRQCVAGRMSDVADVASDVCPFSVRRWGSGGSGRCLTAIPAVGLGISGAVLTLLERGRLS